MLAKTKKIKEQNYLEDDYHRLTLWLNRRHPDVIDEYEEEKGIKGEMLYT